MLCLSLFISICTIILFIFICIYLQCFCQIWRLQQSFSCLSRSCQHFLFPSFLFHHKSQQSSIPCVVLSSGCVRISPQISLLVWFPMVLAVFRGSLVDISRFFLVFELRNRMDLSIRKNTKVLCIPACAVVTTLHLIAVFFPGRFISVQKPVHGKTATPTADVLVSKCQDGWL